MNTNTLVTDGPSVNKQLLQGQSHNVDFPPLVPTLQFIAPFYKIFILLIPFIISEIVEARAAVAKGRLIFSIAPPVSSVCKFEALHIPSAFSW